MVAMNGVYKLEKNENLKEFILALGMAEEFATKALAVNPSMEVTVNGSEVSIKTIYSTKTTELKFKAGAEFDDPMPNGMVLKSVATIEGNKISVKSKAEGNDTGYRTYEFSDNGVVITMGAAKSTVVCKRHYKRT